MAKVVVFLAEGFEEIEAISPIDYLRRAGVEVVTAAIPVNGKSDPLVMGAHKIPVKADMTFDEYIASADGLPDAVVAPGGMPGAANIAACSLALDFIKKNVRAKKIGRRDLRRAGSGLGKDWRFGRPKIHMLPGNETL